MTTVLDVLRKELDEAIETRVDNLAYGGADDFAQYKYLTGVITGLTSALERVKDLQKYEEDA